MKNKWPKSTLGLVRNFTWINACAYIFIKVEMFHCLLSAFCLYDSRFPIGRVKLIKENCYSFLFDEISRRLIALNGYKLLISKIFWSTWNASVGRPYTLLDHRVFTISCKVLYRFGLGTKSISRWKTRFVGAYSRARLRSSLIGYKGWSG